MDARLDPITFRSVIGGGHEDKRWTAALDALQAQLGDAGREHSVPFNLTVTYFIPAEVYGPKFSGSRVSTFLEEFTSLVIQVALPAHPEGDARTELLDLLDAAIAKAESWAKRKKLITRPLEEARRTSSFLRRRHAPGND